MLLIEDDPEEARRFEEHLEESSVGAALRHEPSLEAGLGGGNGRNSRDGNGHRNGP
ncbi:hypothetical protein [Salinibacter sp.]|uniref:hypothetical protein n=1 Tax=Salinibacter sp. TaxID=2065818 RepID=UPI002FC2FFD5